MINLRKTSERLDQPLTSLSEIEFDEHVYELRNSPEYGRGPEPGLAFDLLSVLFDPVLVGGLGSVVVWW